MMKEQSQFKSLLIFAVLAACSYAVYEYQFAKDVSWQFKPFTKGYALFDSEIQITDDQGVIHTEIVSPEIVFFADSELTTIKQPFINYLVNDDIWHLESAEASINSNQSEIFFPSEVTMVSRGTDDTAQLITSALTLYPEQRLAKSAAAMQWQQDALDLKGKGSVIDLNLKEIEVLDEMHAEINP